MISVKEAKEIIREINILPIKTLLPLQKSANKVLAENVFANVDIPLYPQSSMDGYAISYMGWQQNKKLKIVGEIPAGSNKMVGINADEAMAIFTGAALPNGADTIVMKERIKVESGFLFIEDNNLQQGNNVRPTGSEIKAEALALDKETILTPAAIGFLAGIGIAEVTVYKNPTISIVITGNEFQKPGLPLNFGQVYESNSYSLLSALRQLHFDDIKINYAHDDLKKLTEILSQSLSEGDIVLLTGGVSVGEYDYVTQAAAACNVETIFHRVKQKPGKPLYFGKKENKIVFGLPGNPSSVLTCFYEYVVLILEKFTLRKNIIKPVAAPLGKNYEKQLGLTHFLKGIFDGDFAHPLNSQESYKLSSFAKANCLIQIDEATTKTDKGKIVEIHLLPQ